MALACQSNLYGPGFDGDAILLSYLPLAHIYERLAESLTISLGAAIGYFTGDPLRLLEDAQTLKPQFFPSVPRVLNRVYQGAMLAGDVQNFRGAIFRKAVASKLETLRATGYNLHPVWDKLVFRKVIQQPLFINLVLTISAAGPSRPRWQAQTRHFWLSPYLC